MGLAITPPLFARPCHDFGDSLCVVWTTEINGIGSGPNPHSDLPVGQSEMHSNFLWQVGNEAPPKGVSFCNPGPPEEGCLPRMENFPNPMWDWTGKTRYAFEINWLTKTSAEFFVSEVRRPDQNNDLKVDIVDFEPLREATHDSDA